MNKSAESGNPEALVASLFRHESGRLVAALTRLFGPHNLELAEDVVQEALATALQAWKFQLPDNPRAWLGKVARNRALDVIRRSAIERRFRQRLSRAARPRTGLSPPRWTSRWRRPAPPRINCA